MSYSPSLFVNTSVQKPTTRLLRLQNGRTVEYAEYGDPHGRPCFYLHAYLGSCRQAVLMHTVAKREGIRIIAPSRPGIGRSSPHPLRTMTEYAEDIAAIADALDIGTFSLIGTSGGGCFALAVAYALPDRVHIVTTLGCLGPMNHTKNLEQMPPVRRTYLSLCKENAYTLSLFLGWIHLLCRYSPYSLFRFLLWSYPFPDSHILKQEKVANILRWDYEDVFLRGTGIEALLQEASLYFHWGFDLRSFPTSPRVLFLHSEDDPLSPWRVFRLLARQIENSRSVLFRGGHALFATQQTGEIFRCIQREWECAYS